MRLSAFTFLIVFVSALATANNATANNGVVRHAVIAGVNNGGSDRLTLRYATKDAESIYGVFASLGGLTQNHTQLLIEPSAQDLLAALATAKADISVEKKRNSSDDQQRIEFLFYFSGHSDEKNLLIGDDKVSYQQLKEAISAIDADVTLAILDSCASGAFTQLKGGTQVQPFLTNKASKVTGYAFLASSSADEAAQESDAVGGAYFTHYMVSALRGAGDLSEDKKVTLNEAYYFAFNETLTRTEGSQHGPQHAAFNIQLAGEGDLVLTDLSETSGELVLDDSILGRIYIRDTRGNLMVELNKTESKPLKLGLEPGRYKITLEQAGRLFRVDNFHLVDGTTQLSQSNLNEIITQTPTAKGFDSQADLTDVEFKWSLTETNSKPPYEPDVKQRVKVDLNLFGNKTYAISGFSGGAILTNTEQNTEGLQISGAYNHTGGSLKGASISGLMNQIEGSTKTSLLMTAGLNQVKGSVEKSVVFGGVNLVSSNVDESALFATALNFTPTLKSSLQIAGGVNYVNHLTNSLQASGIANIANTLNRSSQFSGVLNLANEIDKGYQLGGVINGVNTLEAGAQIGTVNIAKTSGGHQIGIINIAKELNGNAFGLLNLIGNGRHSVTLRNNELGIFNVELKTGSRYTYTQWSLGQMLDDQMAMFGLAFGARFLDTNQFFMEADIGQTQLVKPELCILCNTDSNQDSTDESYMHLRLNAGKKITKHISLVAGISINGSIGSWNDEHWSYQPIENFADDYLGNALWLSNNNRSWIGYSFGLEIL